MAEYLICNRFGTEYFSGVINTHEELMGKVNDIAADVEEESNIKLLVYKLDKKVDISVAFSRIVEVEDANG